MSEDFFEYDFEDLFDNEKEAFKSEEPRNTRPKTKPGSSGAPLKKDVKEFRKITFKGDPRASFKIIDSCATCKYSVFYNSTIRRGFCALATRHKFKHTSSDLVLKVSCSNLLRNSVYAKYNWVKVHVANHCRKHWIDESKIKTIKQWIQKR